MRLATWLLMGCMGLSSAVSAAENIVGEDKKTELENLEIVNTVRAMVMDKDQIMAFLSTMKDGKSTKNEDTTEVSADE